MTPLNQYEQWLEDEQQAEYLRNWKPTIWSKLGTLLCWLIVAALIVLAVWAVWGW